MSLFVFVQFIGSALDNDILHFSYEQEDKVEESDEEEVKDRDEQKEIEK